jgi:hypothetical protein
MIIQHDDHIVGKSFDRLKVLLAINVLLLKLLLAWIPMQCKIGHVAAIQRRQILDPGGISFLRRYLNC